MTPREMSRRLAVVQAVVEAQRRASAPQPDLTVLSDDELDLLLRWCEGMRPGADEDDALACLDDEERDRVEVIAAKLGLVEVLA